MIPEGSHVSYVGDGVGRDQGLTLDDRGQVVAAAGQASHVVWKTGSLKGKITLTPNLDLVAVRTVPEGDDSLDGPLVSMAVRQTYEERGARGLLTKLATQGHTSGFASIADEALALVTSRIRSDPSFRVVLGSLDEDEGSDLVSVAAVTLLRESFGED